MSPWVRIVIVNYNGGALLAAVLAALAGQSLDAFEVVVVDNASTDGSADGLVLPDARFRLLRSPVNLGFAASSNLGAMGAETPWLAMLNPDAVPDLDWLHSLKTASLTHPWAAMIGSTQRMAEQPNLLDGAGDNLSIFGIAWRGGYGQPVGLTPSRDYESFSPCAAAALYRTEAFHRMGGFAETFFCYLEDVDLGFRLRLAGERGLQSVQAQVAHQGSASSGRHSPFTLFHSSRNGVFLLIRCMPWPLLPLSLCLYVAAQLWLSLRTENPQARRRGLWAGLARAAQHWPARRRIQSSRRLSSLEVARLLIWNPRTLSCRRIVQSKV